MSAGSWRAWLGALRRDETYGQVRRLAGPAIAQQLLHTLVFLVDRVVLGHHRAESLASMQISAPVVWSTTTILGAFTVGSVALVGRRVGAGDRAGAAAALRASLAAALVFGLVAFLGGAAALPGLLRLFPEAGAAVHAEASAYLGVALASMPLLLVSLASAVCLQASGDTRTPFRVAALGNLLNALLTYGLVFGVGGLPPLGARGAALGSAAAMGLQAVLLVALLGRRGDGLSWRGRGGEGEAWRRMARVAAASLGERVVQQTGFMGFVAMIGALGGVAMAANQALISIESVVFLSADGFGIAAASVAAQRLGAKRPDEAARSVRAALFMAAVALSGVGLVFLLVPEWLLGVFSDDRAIVAAGVPCLAVAAVAAPIMGGAVVLSQALRGAGDTRTALGATFLGGLVVRLSATWGFAFGLELGLVGVWLGSTLDWAVRLVLLGVAFRRGRWRTLEV
ncbi:MAG TPA: MATE family efflux transporter [Polyangiaceae bacterium LLY-WYZ-15_(1-7)]|nr:hypothetical protein [Sandaracinus sp.]HJL00057.1 MATE family efflux transporter [Polyangiaceae bacterium LLY-WYZ-15_(1-7)]MBJ71697.1 hypothetical protein [Sandaracinus sp.]HJL11102.1 MATE family efflux transporter [Polyangiaceae bacterium LLY-WYZ-15_(1-7)]HJL24628.1 MATE family efflux transporter [Polyangiaceae bacterium LLY-WYZ-15_(1-7)]